MPTRDIIAIGASAGGVEALTTLTPGFSDELDASIFVVLHLPAEGTSMLPTILNRAGSLPAAHPAEAEPIRRGRIYVAPPDRHLLVRDGRIRLSPGPRENGHRPAIDPLFRSLALSFGARVIAVVLSGTLDDGAAGIESVKAVGGRVVVQDPGDAAYPGMPEAARSTGEADAVVPVSEIADLLVAWSREEVAEHVPPQPPRLLRYEAGIADLGTRQIHSSDSPGHPSALTCPECSGVLWEVTETGVERYRCRVGHAYTAQTLAVEQQNGVEAALWSALRALEERSALAHRMRERMQAGGRSHSAALFQRDANEAQAQAEQVRRLLLGHEEAATLDERVVQTGAGPESEGVDREAGAGS